MRMAQFSTAAGANIRDVTALSANFFPPLFVRSVFLVAYERGIVENRVKIIAARRVLRGSEVWYAVYETMVYGVI